MKWEAVTLIAYFGFNLALHSMGFLEEMDGAVTSDQRSTYRMTFAIMLALMGVLIACVLRLAQ